MANLFSTIPLRQQVDILSKWLTLRYVCRFDSAVCETISRTAFLSLLEFNGMTFSVCVIQYDFNSKHPIDWLICRKMQVVSIVFFRTLVTNHDLRRKFFYVCGRSLQTIQLRDSYMHDSSVLHIGRKDNLPERNTSTTPQVMFDIAHCCSNVQILNFRSIIVDGSMCVLLMGCPHLKEINWTHCGGINCAILAALCTYSLKLKILNVTDSQFFLPAAAKLLPSLHCSTLVQFKAAGTNLTSTQSVALMSVFANLTELELGTLSEEELLSIVVAQPHMQSFKARFGTQLSSQVATKLSKLWREIEELWLQMQSNTVRYVTVMSDETLMVLIAECVTLTTLGLVAESRFSTCESAHEDLESDFSREGQSALRFLHVQNIAPYTFRKIVKACPQLQHFTITQAAPYEADETAEDATEDPYPFELLEDTQVHYLALSNCVNVTDSCIDKLSQLTQFLLSGSPQVTDVAIIELAERCPLLNTMSISACAKTSVELLMPVADTCPKLRNLFFSLASEEETEHTACLLISGVVSDLLSRMYPHLKSVFVYIT